MKPPNPRHRRELDKLLAAHCDESLDAGGKERLTALLDSDEEARRYYVQYLDLHLEIDRRVKQEGVIVMPRQSRQTPWHWWPVKAAAALLILGVGLGIWGLASQARLSISKNVVPGESENGAIAYIGRADGVSWNQSDGAPQVGSLLLPGEVELKSGTLRIDFFSGAAMTVQGPARFRLDDVESVTVSLGQLALEVSGHESHFKVRTPSSVIVDVGTAFAVNVVDKHRSEVLVIEGEVAVSLLGEQGTTLRERSLTEGESLSINSKTGEIQALNAGETVFIDPVSHSPIPLGITPQYVAAVKDSAPIGYWRFEQLEGKQVPNESSDRHAAKVMGPLALEGDERNRVALFADAGKRGFLVQEGFPGIHENGQYSIELWVNPANHDWSGLAALIRIDEGILPTERERKSSFQPPAPRIMALECMPNGESKCWVVHEPRAIRFFHRWPAEDFRHGATHVFSQGQYFPGQWHHVVAVRETDQLCLYHNGNLQSQVQVGPNQDKGTYQLMLGRYARASSDRKFFSGPFSGRIDEVALYDRALNEHEVRAHYKLVSK